MFVSGLASRLPLILEGFCVPKVISLDTMDEQARARLETVGMLVRLL